MAHTTTPSHRLVVIDSAERGPLRAAVDAAVAGLSARPIFGGGVAVSWEPPDATGALPPDPLLLVGHSCLNDCLRAYHAPTFVVSQSGAGDVATGVDVLAYLHDGAAGAIDGGVLAMPEALEAILVTGASERRLLLGAPAIQFARLYSAVIEDWPSDGYGELDVASFRAALALSQLPHLRPASSGRRNYGYPAFATAVNAHRDTTAFSYTPGVLHRVLGRLARLWAPSEELDESNLSREPGGLFGEARTLLPELARRQGFPPQLPVLRGVEREDVSAELYRTLRSVGLLHEDKVNGVAAIRLDLARPQRSRSVR